MMLANVLKHIASCIYPDFEHRKPGIYGVFFTKKKVFASDGFHFISTDYVTEKPFVLDQYGVIDATRGTTTDSEATIKEDGVITISSRSFQRQVNVKVLDKDVVDPTCIMPNEKPSASVYVDAKGMKKLLDTILDFKKVTSKNRKSINDFVTTRLDVYDKYLVLTVQNDSGNYLDSITTLIDVKGHEIEPLYKRRDSYRVG